VVADSGGLVPTVLRPVEGREQVARYALYMASRVPDLTLVERTVNGQPGLVAEQQGVTGGDGARRRRRPDQAHLDRTQPGKLRLWPTPLCSPGAKRVELPRRRLRWLGQMISRGKLA
jgi:hypothetical protein